MLSIIIPTFNEQNRVGGYIADIIEYLKLNTIFSKYEIIISDDGSIDGTVDVVKKFKEVTLLKSSRNNGKGYAVRKGVLHAAGDYILFCDADGATPINEIEKLYKDLKPHGNFDIAIGSRALRESEIVVRQFFLREIMGKIFNQIVRFLCALEFHDTQCGFKLFRRKAARDIFSNSIINRFSFDVEILCLARVMNYSVVESPVKWINSANSKVHIIRDSIKMLIDILKVCNDRCLAKKR